jgi:hypothetical protein
MEHQVQRVLLELLVLLVHLEQLVHLELQVHLERLVLDHPVRLERLVLDHPVRLVRLEQLVLLVQLELDSLQYLLQEIIEF